ncbi:MAG: hypothetical protein ACRELX_02245 [Longimicrobiales bacterium]
MADSMSNERETRVTTGGRDLNMLLAVGRKRLADAHFAHAMELLEHAAASVPAPRALDIYARLHHLTEEEFRALKNRVLVAYARQARSEGEQPATFIGINGDVDWDVTATVLQRLKKRLRGRQNAELRRWVELHSGRVEAELLGIHVENVIRLVGSLGDLTPIADAVRLYMETMAVRNTLYEALAIATADRLFREQAQRAVSLPAKRAADAVATGRRERRKRGTASHDTDPIVALGYE